MPDPFDQPGNPPPFELPMVELPPPNFQDMGKQVASAVTDAGWWASLWKGLLDIVQFIVAEVIGAFMRAAVWIATFFARSFGQARETTEGDFANLAAASIFQLLGVDVAIGPLGLRQGREGRAVAAKSIGEAIMVSLFGPITTGGGPALTPSSKRAEEYLQTVTHLALEGWIEAWLADALTVHEFAKYGELKDVLAQTLGLGRLTRRVMKPPLDILVETPFEWLLNKSYRPKLLSHGELQKAVARERYTKEQAHEEMARQGWSDERIEILFADTERHFDLSDLEYLVSRDLMPREKAINELTAAGWNSNQADLLLDIAESRRLDGLRKELVTIAEGHYVNRDIEADQFLRILETSGLPETERTLLRQAAGLKRELRTNPLSIPQASDLLERGIIGRAELQTILARLGYSPTDALHLELVIVDKITSEREADKLRADRAKQAAAEAADRAKIRAEKLAEAAARAQLGPISLAEFQGLVKSGRRTFEQYRAFLLALKFPPADADDLTAALAGEVSERAAAEKRREEIRAAALIKHISLAQQEAAVKRGILSLDQFRGFLEQEKFEPADQAVLIALLEAELADQAATKVAAAAAQAKAELAKISLAALERSVRLGLTTIDDFDAQLNARDFSEPQRALLVDSLKAELAIDKAAAERRKAAEAELEARKVNLAEREKAVREGVLSTADLRAFLAGQGFSVDDQDLVIRLVELQIERDQAAADARAAAKAKLGEKPLSLNTLEQAVMLGVIPIAAYQAALEKEGFLAGDVQILVLTLLARIKRDKAAQDLRDQARARLTAKGVPIGQLETGYRNRTVSAAEFDRTLIAEGFTLEAAAEIRLIIDAEVALKAAAEERRRQIQAALKVRHVSLAQFEAAVASKLRTLNDYGLFLEGEGFAREDVLLLVELLADKLAAKTAPTRKTPTAV